MLRSERYAPVGPLILWMLQSLRKWGCVPILLSVLKIYSIRYVHYRFLVLVVISEHSLNQFAVRYVSRYDKFRNLKSDKLKRLIFRFAGQSDAFFLPDSFVSCKNASIEHNFVDICTGTVILHNYHKFYYNGIIFNYNKHFFTFNDISFYIYIYIWRWWWGRNRIIFY